MRRPYCYVSLGLLSTAAFLAGGGPLWADNVTLSPPHNAAVNPIIAPTQNNDLVFNETFTNVGDNKTLEINSAPKLTIDAAKGVTTFTKGVNIDADTLAIDFKGSVIFDVTPDQSDPPDPAIIRNKLNVKSLSFEGSGEENPGAIELKVKGAKLDLGAASDVSMNDNIKVLYESGGNLGPISKLNLGNKSAATLDVNTTGTRLDAAQVIVGPSGATVTGPVFIGTPAEGGVTKGIAVTGTGAESGISINGGNLTIDGKLSGGGNQAFTFNTKNSVILTKTASESKLEPGTLFNVDQLVRDIRRDERGIAVSAYQPFQTQSNDPTLVNNFKSLVLQNLAVDQSNFNTLIPSTTGEMYFNKKSGYLVIADYDGQDGMKGVSKYGVPYLQALEAAGYNDMAIYIKGVAKAADVSKELNTLMGNVPNAALSAALSGNMNQVMGHLNSSLSPTMPGFAGPAGAANGLWVLPGYSMTDISGDPKKGYGDLEVKNPSVTLGYDRWINDRIRLGVFAALSQPESTGTYETIKSDNLQAGIYGQAQLNYGINVNAGIAYSRQSHDAERDIPDIFGLGYQQMVKSSFNSNALSAAVEVSRLHPLGQNTFVRPTIGYSYVSTSMDGYTEKSDNAIGLPVAHKVEATDFTLHLLRVGAEGGWSNDLTTVTGRLFWVGNMGDTQPKTQASLISNGSVPFTLVGAEYDKNMVNIGLSAQYTPPQTRGLTFGLNYDALLGSNAKSHNLSLMMRYEF